MNILITGASHGIGKAVAKRFAIKGNTLYLNAFHSADALKALCAELSREYGVVCHPLIYDISNPKEVSRMFEEEQIPPLDVLVNNAGVCFDGLLQDTTIEQWDATIATNLTAVYAGCKEAIPGMIRNGHGKIINISSVWGSNGAACAAAYSASKGGVNALTQALAKELAASNIQVNAIAPGAVDTRMNDVYSDEEKAALIAEIPAGRMAAPAEVAELVWDLANGHEYLTGQIITLDGGWM